MSANNAYKVSALGPVGERELDGLCSVLVDCVEGGDSIGFMWPMTRAKAEAFWRAAIAGAARGERVILIAEDADGSIVGTVSVIWAQPENQPHRADIAKMQVHRSARKQGIGARLLEAAERVAGEAGRTLLVLDTASADAERLYTRGNWQRCGVIPDYALMPDGALCQTIVFYKSLARK
jgi:GNAT superfamily N-acetyltransferase